MALVHLSKSPRLLSLLGITFSGLSLLSQSTPAGSPPTRVRADIASFHLDRQPFKAAANQVGAGVRGDTTKLLLCAPRSGLAASTHPLFVWQLPRGAATKVRFTLLSADESVLYETDLSGSRLQYPEDAPSLIAGQTYSWTVSGRGLDKLPVYVFFGVLGQPTQEGIAKERAAAKDPLSNAQIFLQNEVWYDAIAILLQSIDRQPNQEIDHRLQELYLAIAPGCARP